MRGRAGETTDCGRAPVHRGPREQLCHQLAADEAASSQNQHARLARGAGRRGCRGRHDSFRRSADAQAADGFGRSDDFGRKPRSNPSVCSTVADQVIKLGHAGGDARAVGVAAAGQLQLRQHVPADVRAGLRGKANAPPSHAYETIELRRIRREAVERVRVVLEIGRRRPEGAADVDRVLGDAGNKREVELGRRAADFRPRVPAAKERDPGGQNFGIGRVDVPLVARIQQVANMGHRMDADFEHDVGGVAQHPDVVRTLSDERQLAVPGDGDAVEPSQAAGANVFSQPHVRLGKEKIVTDAEREAPLLCQFAQRAGFIGLDVERLFDKHVHVGLECLSRDVGVRVGRSQDVDRVEAAAHQHLGQRAEDAFDPPGTGEGLGAEAALVGDGDELDAVNPLQGAGMEFGDVARPHEADAHRFVRRAHAKQRLSL